LPACKYELLCYGILVTRKGSFEQVATYFIFEIELSFVHRSIHVVRRETEKRRATGTRNSKRSGQFWEKETYFVYKKKTRYEKREMTWTSVPLHSWTKFRSHKSHCSCVSQYFKMKKIYTISQNFQTKSAWNWTPKNNTKRWTALKVLKCWTTSDIKKDKFGYYNYSFCVLFIANVVYVLVRYLENWSFQRTNEELFLLDPMFQPDNVSIFHRIFSLI